MDTLTGTTAFITGAARGVGFGIARSLAREGCSLALADLDGPAVEEAAARLTEHGPVRAYQLDVRDRARFAEVADAAQEELGPVSVLCNNAGVAFPESLDDLSYELWDLALDINLGGVVNGVQTFLPRILERGAPGHIVNTASAAGLLAGVGPMYTASKFGVVGLSESLRLQLEAAGRPIGVTALCLGGVATDLGSSTMAVAESVRGGAAFQRARDRIRQAAPVIDSSLKTLGVAPDRVGDRVVEAVLGNHLYVLTDRAGTDRLNDRTAAILAAMPEADPAGGPGMKEFENFQASVRRVGDGEG